MIIIPSTAKALILKFSCAFTQPTYHRWVILLLAAILTTGRRTISNLLRTAGVLAPGHLTSYHRVFSKRRWSLWKLALVLTTYILERWVPEGPVRLAGDDTVDQHRGKRVFGKGCHRDPVHSTHSFTAYRWGHKWVVLSILVKFPFATRPWALPVLVALYTSEVWNRKHHRRHRTPAQLMRQLLAVLIHWFPARRFIFTGDGSYGTNELARFVYRHRKHLTLVSRFYADANLYAQPPSRNRSQVGRPRKKGRKQPSPQTIVERSSRRRLTVSWYGGGTRRIEYVTGTGNWFKGGKGLTPIRWIYVHDLTGIHRDEYFFTTDLGMTPQMIVEIFTGRWSIEVTFEEMRAYLGLETTRGWRENTVLRMAPSLFGLFTIVALLYAMLPKRKIESVMVMWKGKREKTFSDAMTAVRRWLWVEWVFVTCDHNRAFTKLSRPFRKILLYAIAPAA